jgi:hypothetical protein
VGATPAKRMKVVKIEKSTRVAPLPTIRARRNRKSLRESGWGSVNRADTVTRKHEEFQVLSPTPAGCHNCHNPKLGSNTVRVSARLFPCRCDKKSTGQPTFAGVSMPLSNVG